MGASLGGKADGPMADINVTPLIDVVLVLLVVFMVITPLLSSGLPVDLPQATASEADKEGGQHIVISITKDGEWAVEQEIFDDAQALALGVRKEAMERDQLDPELLVKADREITYREAREVLDALALANLTKVYLATSKED